MYRHQIRNEQGTEDTSVIFVSLFIAIDFVHFHFIPLPTSGFEITKVSVDVRYFTLLGIKS